MYIFCFVRWLAYEVTVVSVSSESSTNGYEWTVCVASLHERMLVFQLHQSQIVSWFPLFTL